MIPKVIHYCWFGRNPLPESAVKCINSWKKFFPDYEIKEWNEDNFDVKIIPYTREAYEAKKYAFVSDYARFWILYHYGGVYFDTDVEVIKSFEDLLVGDGIFGVQHDYYVNPGLGASALAYHPIYKDLLDLYKNLHFVQENGELNETTIVSYTTDILLKNGYQKDGSIIQHVKGLSIYPLEYFNPLDDLTGKMRKTRNTRSIHWYSKTWCANYGPVRVCVTRWIHRMFGVNSLGWLKQILRRLGVK